MQFSIEPRPDMDGYFGSFGGRFVPEALMPALIDLERYFTQAAQDDGFAELLRSEMRAFAGRPTPLTRMERLSNEYGGEIWLKREDLCHLGAHKINNAIGQALLARRMGKRQIIAETGAGQHGVAAAATAARYGLDCVVYMGREDMTRQEPNVKRMHMFGAKVAPVERGEATLKEAVSDAIRAWLETVDESFYLIGSVVGPHPYPWVCRYFQSVIGWESRQQIIDLHGSLPDGVVACVGGGSNAVGLFQAFIKDGGVDILGVEAGGLGDSKNAASICRGRPGILHGAYTYLLQDRRGQVLLTHSVSAGLDYPAVGPEHANWHQIGRVRYSNISDQDALAAAMDLCRYEGILPALESSHAIATAKKYLRENPGKTLLIGLSGRGDKDFRAFEEYLR